MNGYSDRVNHAFAFAAKHHDREVRKGTRLPYHTRSANVALILTRYGCDEETVVAGILLDVVEDCVRDGWSRETLTDRFGEKFGERMLEIALAVTRRRYDDDGNELDRDDRNADLLSRLASAGEHARWVCAADTVHSGSALLADLRRTVDAGSVWGRFASGRDGTLRWYRDLHERLVSVGFRAPILEELRGVTEALERTVASEARSGA